MDVQRHVKTEKWTGVPCFTIEDALVGYYYYLLAITYSFLLTVLHVGLLNFPSNHIIIAPQNH